MSRRDISRANSQKSTGPKTPEGKAASSKNATRHGILSRTIAKLDPTFPQHVDMLAAAFRPRNMAQQLLVEQLACAYVKISHIQRHSLARLFKSNLHDEDDHQLRLLTRYEAMVNRQIQRTFQLLSERPGEAEPSPSDPFYETAERVKAMIQGLPYNGAAPVDLVDQVDSAERLRRELLELRWTNELLPGDEPDGSHDHMRYPHLYRFVQELRLGATIDMEDDPPYVQEEFLALRKAERMQAEAECAGAAAGDQQAQPSPTTAKPVVTGALGGPSTPSSPQGPVCSVSPAATVKPAAPPNAAPSSAPGDGRR